MKKLIIAASVAAMTVGVYANTCVTAKDDCGLPVEGAGTAHKIAISLKTTKVKSATSKKACADDDCMYWREQTTKKINGAIWVALDDCADCTMNFEDQKVALWDSYGLIDAEFAIGVGFYGKGTYNKSLEGYQSNKVEAYGSIVGEEFGELAFGAFGTVYSSTKKNACADDDCSVYVKSLTGGIAGKLVAPEYTNICADCDPIEYVGCCDDVQGEYTAAYGTIKVTYDTALAKKVALYGDDDEVVALAIKGAPLDFESTDVVIEE